MCVAFTNLVLASLEDASGKEIKLFTFKCNVVLIVNVTSQCGLAPSNYKGLTTLYTKYKNKELEILSFPCDQIGGKDPGSNEEIKEFVCTRFKVEFTIFDKIGICNFTRAYDTMSNMLCTLWRTWCNK
ncbi:hypothetical protein Mapa_001716 [Marchantia paleacea]|nr:hypothetical protein Mapa_001716 [Marchantia paleacea]